MRNQGDRFACLTFAGLGGIAKREMAGGGHRTERTFQLRNNDLLTTVASKADASALGELRTVEDVFWLMNSPIRVERKSDLGRLDRLVSQAAILRGLELRNQLFRGAKPRRVSFKCFVKQDRDYRVRRRQIEERVEVAIQRAFPKWHRADPAALEIWAFFVDGAVQLGFRLSYESMRYHGRRPPSREGALRPTIAGAMVHVAAMEQGECFIDPMCGTGTILGEARGIGTGFGGDCDMDALQLAVQHNVPLVLWDARRLPLVPGVDCIICNLPFGKQFGERSGLPELYAECLSEWQRILNVGGRMVLLTSEKRLLERLATKAGLAVRESHRVKVLGLWAYILRLESKR